MAASSASAKPAPWEVWLAYLRFADHPEAGKVRPVVIVDDMAAAIVVAKVTTADHGSTTRTASSPTGSGRGCSSRLASKSRRSSSSRNRISSTESRSACSPSAIGGP